MQEAPTLETLLRMRGRPVVDRDGHEIGSMAEVYYDRATRLPEWIGVTTSFLGMKQVLVPVRDARIDEGTVRVAFDRDRVTQTPSIHAEVLSEETERRLYEHYGIAYSEHSSPTGLPADVETSVSDVDTGEAGHLERWSPADEQRPVTSLEGRAQDLEREADADTRGVQPPPEILAPEPHIAEEPAAAGPAIQATGHEPASSHTTPEPSALSEPPTPAPITPSPQPPLEEEAPVLTDMPADVPGTLYDTSRPSRRRRAPLIFLGGLGALFATGWLMRRLRRERPPRP